MLKYRREVLPWIADRLTVVAAVWLAAGLAVSTFVVWAFVELADVVIEGDSSAFDRAVLLYIHSNSPGWLNEPMRLITALGYYWAVTPLFAGAILLCYRMGWRLSAILLAVSTGGSIVLTTVLKGVFGRARPELFDSGYQASFYSFPSGHATVAVGFYGMLTVILAYRLRGRARWTVAVSGTLVVLLIGFSRLYLGVHYPTDILAGYLAALLWLVCVGGVYALWLPVRGLRTAESGRDDG
ncbi:Membrane-associated phospholipid phosphatase [uncultured Rubrobacteraceae bacterium]|uniref:Membrane-associated phospholipid phosphatase n=1 Tax=uncultured Rubrobacteraceae bacterium TaxID=349277 RepID=A0A6J4QD97_9ACTN|nr:Membrane-associated phospholipid phosphatase [uncultured Rubrobacteraceae bacterium]